MDSIKIFSDDKDLLLVGGPQMCPTNPRLLTAVILKKKNLLNRLTDFDEIWNGNAYELYAR